MVYIILCEIRNHIQILKFVINSKRLTLSAILQAPTCRYRIVYLTFYHDDTTDNNKFNIICDDKFDGQESNMVCKAWREKRKKFMTIPQEN